MRKQLFPYAKIECARFKGTVPGNFIDQKSVDVNVALQAEQAYQFILRHISQGSSDYTGVYRNDRWEYPIIAIREVIRNAVIHRDYSLSGKDIKIAIFDDKIEITSPGKLMPSVDYSDMDSGQSDIRNKILAPVFKKLGIIEQWGNGLKLIAEELQTYPEIELSWKEPGLAFRRLGRNFYQHVV
ncbi:MAG: ATP-binding protein [Bacteroidales bacterium]